MIVALFFFPIASYLSYFVLSLLTFISLLFFNPPSLPLPTPPLPSPLPSNRNNPQPGQLVQVFASEGTEDQLQETTYLKSSSDLGDDIQFLLGPGCQLPPSPSPPPSPPSPTPVRPSSKGWKWWKTLIVTVGFLLVMGLVVTFVYLLRRLDNSARESHELIN